MTDQQPMRVAGTAVVLRDGAAGLETLLLRRPDRGSFAGAWVFPGGRVDPGDEADAGTETDAARAAAARETFEEAGIGIRDLTPLSCWTPPAEQPVKYRTWFFLARFAEGDVRANPGEIEQAVWLPPAQAFEKHAAGELTLFPPTWMTLRFLLPHTTVDDALAAAGDLGLFATRMGSDERGRFVMWDGDEHYPDRPGDPGARHRLLMGVLPWEYLRR
ncbi:NUDIX hydrolase [Microbacterium sp.]|uniref:NUDIX hydrolase n=1 Tax=Microbacterium sp. TaxID=51671 RepID=UPI003C77EABB